MTTRLNLATRLGGLILAGLLLALSQGVAAEDTGPRRLDLEGRILAIPLASGFCPADRAAPTIDRIVSLIEKAFPKNLRMLALDFECDWIEATSSGRTAAFPRYIVHVAVQNPDGTLTTYPWHRDVFLESLAASFAGAEGRQAVEKAHAEAEREVLDQLNRLTDSPASIEDTHIRPGLADDAAGVYSGVVAKIEYRGNVTSLACVSSVTLIKGAVVGVNLCREHGGSGTFEDLLTEAQSITGRLVEANDPEL